MVAEESVLALLTYCLSSILMTVFNKYVLSSHAFRMNFFLLLIQCLLSILLLSTFKSLGLLSYKPYIKMLTYFTLVGLNGKWQKLGCQFPCC